MTTMSSKISRSAYADMFGPTKGDRVRLADTDLIIEGERGFTSYGEEGKFKGGKVPAIGKAGNPDIQSGVTIVIGPGTEVIAGEGKILPAGGFDAHIHFICPQQVEAALMSGITSMLGGGTGPAAGTNATTCTPGPWHMARMIQAADAFPVNLRFAGK